MRRKLLAPEVQLYTQAPAVCTKPGCGGTVFIPHEDGWQCFNCMKVIYKSNEGIAGKSIRHQVDRE
jgi:hypothetical protein